MSKPDFAAQNRKLTSAVKKHLTKSGEQLSQDAYSAALPLLTWVDYLSKSEATGICDDFLSGVKATVAETSGCLAMGLVRPAIFSMRGQIDTVLCWLYFKDHPIEWRRVEERGDGFVLKGAVIAYLCEYFPSFSPRFSLLSAAKVRKLDDPYGVLSAHIHSQVPSVMPTVGSLATLVRPLKTCNQCLDFQKEVTEYLSDVLMAVFADKWASLPDALLVSAQARLGVERSARVFGDPKDV